MKELTESEIDDLAQVCFVANTPAYLWDRFRDSPIVNAMAKSASIPELRKVYDITSTKRDASTRETAIAYAALVAITLKEFDDARRSLEQLSPYSLPWTSWIINAFLSRPVSWNTTSVSVKSIPFGQKSVASNSTPSSLNTIDMGSTLAPTIHKVQQ